MSSYESGYGRALPLGTVLNGGRYRVHTFMKEGGFGITYKVQDLWEDKRASCYKVMKECFTTQFCSRGLDGVSVLPGSGTSEERYEWNLQQFAEEAKTQSKLDHLNVMPVTDYFHENGTAYFVMPFYESQDLADWLLNNPKPSQNHLKRIFKPLLDGLSYAHKKSLLHRDIKPSNLLLTRQSNVYEIVPMLIDFGTAKFSIGRNSQLLDKVLSPPYAPPEQYAGQGYMSSVDVYSFCVTMYESISGVQPPESLSRTLNPSFSEQVIPLTSMSDLKDRYDYEFLAAIDKGMSIQPQERQQTAMQLRRELFGEEQESAGNHIDEFKKMIMAAGSDGYIDNGEQNVLQTMAEKLGISKDLSGSLIGDLAIKNGWDVQGWALPKDSSGHAQITSSKERNVLLDYYFSIQGRVPRKEYYFKSLLPSLAISALFWLVTLLAVDSGMNPDTYLILMLLCLVASFTAAFSGTVKRFHDLNQSGWHYLFFLIPFVGLYFTILVVFFRGTIGENQFGSDPLDDKAEAGDV